MTDIFRDAARKNARKALIMTALGSALAGANHGVAVVAWPSHPISAAICFACGCIAIACCAINGVTYLKSKQLYQGLK